MSTSASMSVATDAAIAQASPRQVMSNNNRSLITEPTAAMVAARQEFETRRAVIAPEDDPFWELRGCKGDHLLPPPVPEVPIKPVRKLAEIIETIAPLPPNSHLLTPTTATKLGSYSGSPTHTPLRVSAIPETSHLLTPTKATILAEIQRSDSKEHSVNSRPAKQSTSPSIIPGVTPVNVTSKLMEPTIAYLSAKRNKADTAPPQGLAAKEAGWVNVAVSPPPNHPTDPPPPPAPAQHYKHVTSKLMQPTASYTLSQWKQNQQEKLQQETPQANGKAKEHQPHNNKYANVPSRLHASTAAVSAGQWKNQPASPENKAAVSNWIGNEKSAEPPKRKAKSLSPSPAPSKLQTPTAATVLSQRTKYTKVDPLDIKYKDQMARRPRRNSGGSTGALQREHPVDPDELLVEATRLLQMQPAFMQVTLAMEKASAEQTHETEQTPAQEQREEAEEQQKQSDENVEDSQQERVEQETVLENAQQQEHVEQESVVYAAEENNNNEMTFLTNATINTTYSDAEEQNGEVMYDSDNTSEHEEQDENVETAIDATVLEAANLQTSNSAATVDDQTSEPDEAQQERDDAGEIHHETHADATEDVPEQSHEVTDKDEEKEVHSEDVVEHSREQEEVICATEPEVTTEAQQEQETSAIPLVSGVDDVTITSEAPHRDMVEA